MDTFGFDPQQQERWTVFDKRAVESIEKNKKYEWGYE
jgi:hypothetical protein